MVCCQVMYQFYEYFYIGFYIFGFYVVCISFFEVFFFLIVIDLDKLNMNYVFGFELFLVLRDVIVSL